MIRFAAVVALWALASPGFAAEPASPSHGVPYSGDLGKFFYDVAQGNVGLAMETVERLAGTGIDEERWSAFRKELAAMVARNGECDGWELTAVRRLSPRTHQVYCLLHYRMGAMLFTFHMRQFQGRWKMDALNFTANLDEYRGLAPVEFFAAAPSPAPAAEAAETAPLAEAPASATEEPPPADTSAEPADEAAP